MSDSVSYTYIKRTVHTSRYFKMPRSNVRLGRRCGPLSVRGYHSVNWKNKDKCFVGFSSSGRHKCQLQCPFWLMERVSGLRNIEIILEIINRAFCSVPFRSVPFPDVPSTLREDDGDSINYDDEDENKYDGGMQIILFGHAHES